MKIRSTALIALIVVAIAMLLPVQAPAAEPEQAAAQQPEPGDLFSEALVDMDFVYIAPGTFIMGTPEDEPGRYPDETQHEVEIKKGFWMGEYEVTFEQYDHFCKKTGNTRVNDEHWGRGQRPAIYIKWYNAQAFADWLSRETGHTYRLPTEAEWEYAARAGTTTAFSWGDNPDDFPTYAWNSSNTDEKSHPVGLKRPNPWGLYDMHGNVWEWTGSYYEETYDGSEQKYSDVKSKKKRSVRGGAWYFFPKGLRSGDRRLYNPHYRLPYIGFRLVREES
ncbi:MAG: formylglycine-generating enzyme family protein [Mariprofundaceae bacterium]